MKTCSKCLKLKSFEEFGINNCNKDGLYGKCKICINAYSRDYDKRNPEKKKAKSKREYAEQKALGLTRIAQWSLANPEKRSEYVKQYTKNHPEESCAKSLRWAKNNPGKKNAANAKRKARLLQQSPKWLTGFQLKEIESWYQAAADCQWLSEEPLEVDHIVPLKGENVSGLHVPWNLQILTASKNASKGNRI